MLLMPDGFVLTAAILDYEPNEKGIFTQLSLHKVTRALVDTYKVCRVLQSFAFCSSFFFILTLVSGSCNRLLSAPRFFKL
jgi:hypothetical protein